MSATPSEPTPPETPAQAPQDAPGGEPPSTLLPDAVTAPGGAQTTLATQEAPPMDAALQEPDPAGFGRTLPQLPPQANQALPSLPPMPEPSIPAPEPAQPAQPAQAAESWRDVTPGSPAFPVRLLDGTFAAGGLVGETLCVDPSGAPRCIHLGADRRCSGPPTEEMRRSMTRCIAYRDRHAGQAR